MDSASSVLIPFLFVLLFFQPLHVLPQWRPRRFSALEHGIHPPQAQSKIGDLEQELELEPEPEPEPEPESELEPEAEADPEPQQP